MIGVALANRNAILKSSLICVALIISGQITIPFWPVPATSQTFLLTFLGFAWGKKAFWPVAAYLFLGLFFPVLGNWTQFSLSFLRGGYVLGFLPGIYLASQGQGRSLRDKMFWGILAHTCIYSMGWLVLSYFIGPYRAWSLGVWPFLLGDLVKVFLAAILTSRIAHGN